MATRFDFSKISILFVICSLALITPSHGSDDERKVYIVYMGNLVATNRSAEAYHTKMLEEVVGSRFAAQSLVRSYKRSFNGFAAYLTPQEHEKLAGHEEVVSIFPSTTYKLQTTRSWDFIGFPENVTRNPTIESDTIIGVIDSGIWPESQSFTDKGFGPVPKKWKGVCSGGTNFTCNNKIIGARYYNTMSPNDTTARDNVGHGSHTSSIAAGVPVRGASFYGIAEGTARGGAPSARIAVYKVCHKDSCGAVDLLAALDDAIADGVDIITISLGGDPLELKSDVIAIGSFHAAQHGVLVVQSAGNGAAKATVASVAPWIFSVGASSTDRGIITRVALGNGSILTGKSVNSFDFKGKSFPLAYGKDVTIKCNESSAMDCAPDCIVPSLVKGKIVLCRMYDYTFEVYNAGALGIIFNEESFLPDNEVDDDSDVAPIAAIGLKRKDFNVVEGYFNSTKSSEVNILTSESTKNLDAPRVAGFSSKGPSTIIPDILKPDITAPGMEILAAYSPLASPSEYDSDHRSVNYNIISGTSMSCPHVAGAAAYVKSFRPNWSPSAIKSALMTTARKLDPTKDQYAEFAYGAGQIDPIKAVDAGLVYETSTQDYITFLCNLGYDSATIKNMFKANATCPAKPATTIKDLNYPSMTSQIKTAKGSKSAVTFSEKFTRTVTNVGAGKSTYKATASAGPGYNISVTPSVLTFAATNEKKTFEVVVSGKIDYGKMLSASLEWSDGVHLVRSPIVVFPDNFFDS
ncbi:hypothetical protein ABFX02_12G109400 [Erythranthe guttata]